MTNNIITESSVNITDTTNLDDIVDSIINEQVNTVNINDTQTSIINNTDSISELQTNSDNIKSAIEDTKKELSELLIDESISRFSGAEWFEKIHHLCITLAGIGGIGSWLSLLLARLNIGFLTLIDNDDVEEVNLAGQLFATEHIGYSKVGSICNTINKYTNFRYYSSFTHRFDSSYSSPIMICGFDNMQSRLEYFNSWIQYIENNSCKEQSLFIDGRVSAEELQVFCITGDDIYNQQRYRNEFIFPDSEAESEVCSYKQTTFMTNMIASIMANLFVNFAANLCKPTIERDLPFFTYYDAKFMIFKTEK